MSEEEKINEVLENFSFYKVQRVMDFLNWKWLDTGGTFAIPSYFRMIEDAKDLLYRCKNNKNETVTISTGGFVAHKKKDKNGESFYSLSFVICESCNL